jgi:two-component system NtrC family response regulator
MADVLIIDDDELICDALASVVIRMGHTAAYAVTLSDGLKKAASGNFDVVFLDVRLPDGNGLAALPEIRISPSSPEVVIITAEGDPDGAELAIKNGAWDYLEKPASIDQMTLPLVRALQYKERKDYGNPPVVLNREGIIGDSRPMKKCLDLLAQAANSKASVLISGETGTGKELFARAIHDNNPYVNENFVVVDCAAIPESLVESSLFGYRKGAFTGADKPQDGLIKQADGGTLFLDEVGELPMPLQGAFLRVLQEHSFRPLGGEKEVKSDFRLLAATNKDLEQMVRDGNFRKDLLFRIRAITIQLPPLRERPEDIKALVMSYMTKLCEIYGIEKKSLSPDILEIFYSYAWPGNVRELVNALDSAIAASRFDDTLFIKHLPTRIRVQVARTSLTSDVFSGRMPREKAAPFRSLPSLKDYREIIIAIGEKKYLQDLMSSTGGDIKEACSISGLGRSRLYDLMKKHDVSRVG